MSTTSPVSAEALRRYITGTVEQLLLNPNQVTFAEVVRMKSDLTKLADWLAQQ